MLAILDEPDDDYEVQRRVILICVKTMTSLRWTAASDIITKRTSCVQEDASPMPRGTQSHNIRHITLTSMSIKFGFVAAV